MANRLYQIEQLSGNTIQFSGDVGTVWYAVTNNIHVAPMSGVIEDESGLVNLTIDNAEFSDAYGSITIHADYCKPLFLDNVSYFSEYPKRRIEIVYLDKNHTESSVTITTNDTFIYEYERNDGFTLSKDDTSLTFTFANETDYETREWVYTSTRNTRLFVDILVISRPSGSDIDCSKGVECSIDPNITLTYDEPSCAVNAYALYDGYRYIPFTLSEECGIDSVFTYSQDASIITFSVKEDVLADSSITSATCSFLANSELCNCNGPIEVTYNRYGGDEDEDVYGSIVFTVLDNTTSAIVSNITASISLRGNSGKYKYRTNFVDGVAIFKKVRYDANGYTYNVTIENGEYTFEVFSSITTPCSGISGTVSPIDFVKSSKDSYSVVGGGIGNVPSPIYETIKRDIFVDYTTESIPWRVTQWSSPTLSSVTSDIEYLYEDFNRVGYDVYDTATLQQDESMLVAQLPFIHEASAYTITLLSNSIAETAVTNVEVFNGIDPTPCDSKYGELSSNGTTLVFTNGSYYIVVDYVPNDDPIANFQTAITLNVSDEEQTINLNKVDFIATHDSFIIQNNGVTSTTARINNSSVTVYAEAAGDEYPLTYKFEKESENCPASNSKWVLEDGFNLKITKNRTDDERNCYVNFKMYSSLTTFDETTIVRYKNGDEYIGRINVIQDVGECDCNDVVFTFPEFRVENVRYYYTLPSSDSGITSINYVLPKYNCGRPSFSYEKMGTDEQFVTLDSSNFGFCYVTYSANGTNQERTNLIAVYYGQNCMYYVYITQPSQGSCQNVCQAASVIGSTYSQDIIPYSGGQVTLSVIFRLNYTCGNDSYTEDVAKDFIIDIGQNPSTSTTTYNKSYHIDSDVSGTSVVCHYIGNISYSYIQEGLCEKQCNGVEVVSKRFLPNPVPYEGVNGSLMVEFRVNFICGDERTSETKTHTFDNIIIGQNPSTSTTTYSGTYHVNNYRTETNPSCTFNGDITYTYVQNGLSVPCEWILDNCTLNDLTCVPETLICSGGNAVVYASSVIYNYRSNGFCSQETSSVTEYNVILTNIEYTANTTDSERLYTLNLSGTTSKGCNLDGVSLIVPQSTCCLACNSITNFNCMTIPKIGGTDVLIATYHLSNWCDDNKTSATIAPVTTEDCTPDHYEITSCSNGEIRGIIPQNNCGGDFDWNVTMYYNGVECPNAKGKATQNGTITTTNITMPLFLQMNDNFSGVVNSGVTNVFAPLGFLETDLDSATLTMEQVVNHPNFITLNPLTKYLFDYIGTNACTIAYDNDSSFHDSVFKYADRYGQTCDAQWTDIDTLMATYDYLSDYPQKHMGNFSISPLDGSILFTRDAETIVEDIMIHDSLYRDAVTFAESFAEDNTVDRNNQPFVITKNNKKVYIVYKQGTSIYCEGCYGLSPCSEITSESLDKRCCVDFVDYNYGENKRYCTYSTGGEFYEWHDSTDNRQTFVLSTRPIFYNPLNSRYQWSFSTTFDTSEKTEMKFPYSYTFPAISNSKLDGLGGNSSKPINIFKHKTSTTFEGFYPFINEVQTNRVITGTTNMFPLVNGWQTLSFDNWYHAINEETITDNMDKIGNEQMLFGFVDDTIMKEFIVEVVDENNNYFNISGLQFGFTDYTYTPSMDDGLYIYDPPSTSVTADLPLFKTTMGSPVIEGEDLHGDTYIIDKGDPNYVYLTPKVKKLLIHVNLDSEETTAIDVIEEN